jgi:hypothetical protein
MGTAKIVRQGRREPATNRRLVIREGGRDDSDYVAFILKWLTPHSLPSA